MITERTCFVSSLSKVNRRVRFLTVCFKRHGSVFLCFDRFLSLGDCRLFFSLLFWSCNLNTMFVHIHQISHIILLCMYCRNSFLIALPLRYFLWKFFLSWILNNFWKRRVLMNRNSSDLIDWFLSLSLDFFDLLIKIRGYLDQRFIKLCFLRIGHIRGRFLVLEFEVNVVYLSCLVFNVDDEKVHWLGICVISYLDLRISRFGLCIVLFCNVI